MGRKGKGWEGEGEGRGQEVRRGGRVKEEKEGREEKRKS